MNIEQLLNTKTGQKLVNDFNVEQDKQRSDLFIELEALRKKRDADLPPLNRTLEQATVDCDEAQRVLELAQATKHTASVKVSQAKAGYSSQVTRIEKEMMLSAPPEIDTFCESLQEEATKLRSTAIKSPPNMVYTTSVNARVSAIRDAADKANKLKLVDVADISSELQKLYDALPPMGSMQ